MGAFGDPGRALNSWGHVGACKGRLLVLDGHLGPVDSVLCVANLCESLAEH